MKSIALAVLVLVVSKVSLMAGVDLGSQAGSTPYDRYLGPVRSVLSGLNGHKADMASVKKFMKEGRSFRYSMETPYVPSMPSVTASNKAGDCKDKALWLCDQLKDPSVRFVIGKTSRSAKMSHAWVMWQNEGRWWILDCTLKSEPVTADSVGEGRYIPLYSYSRSGSFRHAESGALEGVASR